MGPDHPSGLGGLLKEFEVLRLASACSDRCPAIAAMFNATGESGCAEIQEATDGMVYLQCWPHIARKVRPPTDGHVVHVVRGPHSRTGEPVQATQRGVPRVPPGVVCSPRPPHARCWMRAGDWLLTTDY